RHRLCHHRDARAAAGRAVQRLPGRAGRTAAHDEPRGRRRAAGCARRHGGARAHRPRRRRPAAGGVRTGQTGARMSQEHFPRAKTAIVSSATYGIGEAPGLSSLDLAVRASVQALAGVGLTPADVDGLFIGLPDDYLSGLSFTEYLGIAPRLTDNNRTGGSSFL